MRKLTEQLKKERGWYFIVKEKYYWRDCDFCEEEYQGMGKYFCSKSCSLKSRPFDNYGDKNYNYKEEKNKCIDCYTQVSTCSTVRCSDCFAKFNRGENHPCYIEDRTKVVKSEKKHLDGRYKEWMKAVKDRDNWKCRIADVKCNGRLEAHHILDWVNYPELRYDINNGITLCQVHHPRGRTKEKQLSSYLQELVLVLNE